MHQPGAQLGLFGLIAVPPPQEGLCRFAVVLTAGRKQTGGANRVGLCVQASRKISWQPVERLSAAGESVPVEMVKRRLERLDGLPQSLVLDRREGVLGQVFPREPVPLSLESGMHSQRAGFALSFGPPRVFATQQVLGWAQQSQTLGDAFVDARHIEVPCL